MKQVCLQYINTARSKESESARYAKLLLTENYMECGGNGIRRKKMIKGHQVGHWLGLQRYTHLTIRYVSRYLLRDTILSWYAFQDSLLEKRWNDNHSPGPVIRELVPSSHQRSELSNTILCIFSGWDQRIGEGIPIPDSLGEEATFINICIGNWSLKFHRVLIPTTPSFGDKVICWYTGFTCKTYIVK